MERITEKNGKYRDLDKKSVGQILVEINSEDQTVAKAVQKCIPAIERLVEVIVGKMSIGGRLFYMGAGTSGRLGILDASECPPTFGVSHDMVIALIAGGDSAIRKAVEFAEDDTNQALKDLKKYNLGKDDIVIGIAASGTTPYVVGGIKQCNDLNIETGCITCNESSPLAMVSKHPIEVIVGPEYVRGSTRMKSGTAQKLVLNMISTSVMIKLGKVVDNRMVDMQLSNDKLVDRGTKMVVESSGLSYIEAKEVLENQGSVRAALEYLSKK